MKKRVALKNQAVPANNGVVGTITGRSFNGFYAFTSEDGQLTIEGLTDKQFREVSDKYKARVKEDVPVVKKDAKIKALGNIRVRHIFKDPVGMKGEDFSVVRVGTGRNSYKVYAARRPGDATKNPSGLFVDWVHLGRVEQLDESYTDAYVLFCSATQLKEIKSWAKDMNFTITGDRVR